MIMEYVSVPVIVMICYLVGEIVKLILRKKKRFKFIPVIVGCVGGMLGIIIYYVSPEHMLNVTNPFVELSIGMVSGLASTGGNELIKQVLKKE